MLTQEGADGLVLDMDGGSYFSLEGVGRRIWELRDGSRSVERIIDDVFEE